MMEMCGKHAKICEYAAVAYISIVGGSMSNESYIEYGKTLFEA